MPQREKRRWSAAAIVLTVLLVGTALGFLLAAVPVPSLGPGPGRGPGFGLRLETSEDVDVLLSTIGIALLLALLAVYVRTYADTKANFAFGVAVVVLALLVQSLLTSPLVYGAFGHSAGGAAPFLLFADVFKVAAFAVFLYLSLQ